MISEPNYITSINTGIRFMASYCTDSDGFQYVVVAAEDGYVYQVNWHPSELAPGYHPSAERLWYFGNSMATIAGFFTLDDNYHHAVVGTKDPHTQKANLHELYYKLGATPQNTDLPYAIDGFQDSKGMAGFYSPDDNLRHVVIVDRTGKLEDITFQNARYPEHHTIPVPFQVSQIASISGFVSDDYPNPNKRHIIVALKTGQIYDIDYPDERHIPQTVGQNYVRTSFNEPVKNVTAFFCPDSHKRRHIVVLTEANLLKLLAYDINGDFLEKKLLNPHTSLGDVADITSFYNAHDGLCHVLYATTGGDLSEITYTSQ